ncbi:hypothetical protein MKX54_03640 [Alkalihalobacillus sp. FSL R5-0424]
MNDKELMQKHVVESIFMSFKENSCPLNDMCVYASYITRDLLREKYNLEAEVVAGELDFRPLGLEVVFRFNLPCEFHVWNKLNGEIIDIAASNLTTREEFKSGRLSVHRNKPLNVVWEENPYDGRQYKEVLNGIKEIESPLNEPIYLELYTFASKKIDEWRKKFY